MKIKKKIPNQNTKANYKMKIQIENPKSKMEKMTKSETLLIGYTISILLICNW